MKKYLKQLVVIPVICLFVRKTAKKFLLLKKIFFTTKLLIDIVGLLYLSWYEEDSKFSRVSSTLYSLFGKQDIFFFIFLIEKKKIIIQVMLMSYIYHKIAKKLNDWENIKTYEEYENRLIQKLVFFEFCK